MGRVQRKLQSERGASMLLALLFFMVCTMVALSILISAVSNAGKIQSNKEEHQKYLALSSALELLCDDLVNAEYTGRYCYSVTPQEPSATGGSGEKDIKTCTQLPGDYTGEFAPFLKNELDTLFAGQIQKDAADKTIETDERYQYQYQMMPGYAAAEHTVTVAVSDTESAKNYPELSEYRVTVVVKLADQYAIRLSASLDGVDAYELEAEITPTENVVGIGDVSAGEHVTLPMKWKLGWMAKSSSGM